MAHVLILVSEDWQQPSGVMGTAIAEMVSALKQAIALSSDVHQVQVWVAGDSSPLSQLQDDTILCPLTLDVPPPFRSDLYDTCVQVEPLRDHVQQTFQVASGNGHFWLPVVLTAKGPLYGEVIGTGNAHLSREPAESANQPELEKQTVGDDQDVLTSYIQPIHLPDRLRQPLYRLGGRLLRSLAAPPSVYLLQFDLVVDRILFDRLLPFPGLPAIASIGVQVPDLFACYWRCLTHQPILDLIISDRRNGLLH